jgi:cold shock CspA family protein
MGRKVRGDGLRDRAEASPVEELLKELMANKSGLGRVMHYNQAKGYGFISSNNGDIYFHITAVVGGKVERGQLVRYQEKQRPDGKLLALRVEVVEEIKQAAAACR